MKKILLHIFCFTLTFCDFAPLAVTNYKLAFYNFFIKIGSLPDNRFPSYTTGTHNYSTSLKTHLLPQFCLLLQICFRFYF